MSLGSFEQSMDTYLTDTYKSSAALSAYKGSDYPVYVSSSLKSLIWYHEQFGNWVIGTPTEVVYARLEGYKECPSDESLYGMKWFVYQSNIEDWLPGIFFI